MERLKSVWRSLKTWQKAVVIVLAMAAIGAVLPKEEQPTPASKPESTAKEDAPAKATKEPAKPFSEGELTQDTITKAAGLKTISKVDIIPDAAAPDKKIVNITYALGASWDENGAVRQVARDSVSAMEKLFAHPGVSEVGIWAEAKFTDQYGKESMSTLARLAWSRATADKVEWKNFSNMIVTEPKRAFLLARDYWIHPGVYSKVTDKTNFPASK